MYKPINMKYLLDKKVVFFDFDDTLCIHLSAMYDEETRECFLEALETQQLNFFMNRKLFMPNSRMFALAKLLKENGADIRCLSFVTDERAGSLKEYFLDGLMPFHSITLGQSKAEFIVKYCEERSINLEDALLIDDAYANLRECNSAGIDAIQPFAIATYLEEVFEKCN